MRKLAVLIFLLLPAAAGETEDLVDRLFDADPAVRAAAREKLGALGDGTLQKVLARIEARHARSDLLHVYALDDFKQDETWWKLALVRVRAVVARDGDVRTRDGTVIVRAPGKVQERVAEELASLRRAFGRMVSLQVRYVRFAKKPAVERVPLAQLDAFLEKHEGEVVSAPRLTCRNGQRASISVLHDVSYVADFDVEVAERGVIADPVVDTVHEGVRVELRAVVDGGSILIALEASRSELERPMPTMRLPLPGMKDGKIQVPVGRSRSVTRLVRCAPDAAALVDLGGGDALLVSAQAFEVADEAHAK